MRAGRSSAGVCVVSIGHEGSPARLAFLLKTQTPRGFPSGPGNSPNRCLAIPARSIPHRKPHTQNLRRARIQSGGSVRGCPQTRALSPRYGSHNEPQHGSPECHGALIGFAVRCVRPDKPGVARVSGPGVRFWCAVLKAVLPPLCPTIVADSGGYIVGKFLKQIEYQFFLHHTATPATGSKSQASPPPSASRCHLSRRMYPLIGPPSVPSRGSLPAT